MRHTAQTVLGAVLDLPPEQSTLLLQTLSDPRATAELFLALEVTLLLPPSPAEQGPRPE
jgi:hypothetical protein